MIIFIFIFRFYQLLILYWVSGGTKDNDILKMLDKFFIFHIEVRIIASSLRISFL